MNSCPIQASQWPEQLFPCSPGQAQPKERPLRGQPSVRLLRKPQQSPTAERLHRLVLDERRDHALRDHGGDATDALLGALPAWEWRRLADRLLVSARVRHPLVAQRLVVRVPVLKLQNTWVGGGQAHWPGPWV